MENHSFEYTYSARRQQEVEEIRKKYLPQEEDKMEELRKLHSIPTQKAQAASISLGVIGTLMLGTGRKSEQYWVTLPWCSEFW